MRIVDVMDNDIRACAQFEYKGWIVSMSTIFSVSVYVFKDGYELECSTIFKGVGVSVYVFKDGYELECKSVEQAIELINKESRWYKVENGQAFIFDNGYENMSETVSIVHVSDLYYYRQNFKLSKSWGLYEKE